MTKEQMEQIVLDNMQKIYLYCVRRLGNTTEAEDVASDVVLELLRSYDKVKEDKAVYGYLWAVAENLCKNYWRRAKRYETVEIPEDYEGTFEITPEETCIQKQDISVLRRELSLLGEKYREIMIAHYVRKESCEIIARNMNLSETNVKQYLFEGRKKVKKGMDKQREYGVYSYAPEKFTFHFFGDSDQGYRELFNRKLPGSIMLAVYDSPKTMEELSMEVGVSVPYLEEDVSKLEEYQLIVKKGQKYYSGITIYNSAFQDKVNKDVKMATLENIDLIKSAVEKGKKLLADTDYQCYQADENVKSWFLVVLLIWEAAQKSEGKMKTRLSFPLLANGSKGYVMGKRGENVSESVGIYGMYSLNHGYLRAMNFKRLTDRVVNPFEKGAREVLCACEVRSGETTQLETLSDMLEKGIVHVEDGKICPNYSEISERDYFKLMDGLTEEIDAFASIVATLRDDAADSLAREVPKEIPNVREIGSIVCMSRLIESVIPAMLDSGYLTKGSDEQNLTTLYVRTN